MSKPSTRVPRYRQHKGSGQARVTINGRDHYLGVYGTPESKERYRKVLAQHLGRRPRTLAEVLEEGDAHEAVTVEEVLAAFWEHASAVYVYEKTGRPKPELSNVKHALRVVRSLFGSRGTQEPNLLAIKFGPLRLKQCRQVFVEEGHTRSHVNDQVARIRRLFRWATENELVPPAVFHGLQAVRGLRRAEGGVREGRKVEPVAMLHVEAVLPHVSRQLAAVIQLQLLTGARPGEILQMRPMDIDRDGPHGCWIYRPASHKTDHHGHDRVIFIGPKGQAVLGPLLDRGESAFCFSPAEAERDRNDAKSAARKCKPSRIYDPKRRRKANPKRKPQDCYTVASYRRAVERACERAGVPRWTPHQLRHSAATGLRREFGVETAQVTLGHRSLDVTEIYAERDLDAVARAIAKVG